MEGIKQREAPVGILGEEVAAEMGCLWGGKTGRSAMRGCLVNWEERDDLD